MSLLAAALLLAFGAELPSPSRLLTPLPDRLTLRVDQRPTLIGVSGTIEVLVDPTGHPAGCTAFDVKEPEGARFGGSMLPCAMILFAGRFSPALNREGDRAWGLWRWSFRWNKDRRLVTGAPSDLAKVQVSAIPSGQSEVRVSIVLDVTASGMIEQCRAIDQEKPQLTALACPGLLLNHPTLKMVRRDADDKPAATVRAATVLFTVD